MIAELKTLNNEINANDIKQKTKMELLLDASKYPQRMPLTVREFNKIYNADVRKHTAYFFINENGFVEMTDWGKQTINFLGI